MKIDCVVMVENPSITVHFYPISLSTPVQNIIIGGLRFFEYYTLLSYAKYKSPVDILLIVREYLSKDWTKIYKSLILTELLDIKSNVIYISDRDYEKIMKILSKYDRIVVLPANVILNNVDYLEKVNILNVKDIDNIRRLFRVAIEYEYTNFMINSIFDIIRKNVEYLEIVCSILRSNEYRIIINTNTSGINLPKRCVLYNVELSKNVKLRDGAVLYTGTVIGSEVKNSIIDVYTHAEHYGYIGDSYIGRFVNFGAGTTISNLKNTKGEIKYLGFKTGLIKLGSIIGDHVKTAIGTLIYSGKSIGSYSHVYGLVETDVPPAVTCKNSTLQVLEEDKLAGFLRRWCYKYIGGEGTDIELSIMRSIYGYCKSLSEEPLSHVLFLYRK